MLVAMLALQSAFACGPYGAFASSEDGAWAYENDDVISVYSADGERYNLPIYGEVIDMDFVGDELVVAYEVKNQGFAILFDASGEEVAEWSPREQGQYIDSIVVLPKGLMVLMSRDGYRSRARLTDDLRLMGRPSMGGR